MNEITQKRLIGWRSEDYTMETDDPAVAKNWAGAIGVLPIFEGDINTRLTPPSSAMLAKQPVSAVQSAVNDAMTLGCGFIEINASGVVRVNPSDVFKQPQIPLSAAIRDVIVERQRQITAEGWTPEHDDEYHQGELSYAAACYSIQPDSSIIDHELVPDDWPWAKEWWKPSSERRNLVKAGALILAEIERLDRTNGDKGNK